MELLSKDLLKNVDKITEATFKISQNRRLFERLFGKDSYNPFDGKLAYAVYSRDNELIRGYQIYRKKDLGISFKQELADYITLCNPNSFEDFLFILMAAPFGSNEPAIREICKKQYQGCDVVDSVLENTKGFLIFTCDFRRLLYYFWDKGLEDVKEVFASYMVKDRKNIANVLFEAGNRARLNDLCQNLYRTEDFYTELPSMINRKDKYCWDLMARLKFSGNYNMRDVLKERMIKRYIYNPNIRMAYNLYRVMKDLKKEI